MEAARLLLAQAAMAERQRQAKGLNEAEKRRAAADYERARYHRKKAQARAQRKAEREARRIARQHADRNNLQVLDALARSGKLSESATYNAGFIAGFSAGKEYESRTVSDRGETEAPGSPAPA